MQLVTDLDVYNLAEELSDMIWYDYDEWPTKVQYSIGYQILKSSDSISANISEGFGRYSMKDRLNFYIYSRGSFEETKCWLRKLMRRKVIMNPRKEEYIDIIEKLGPRLNKFITNTRNNCV